jgi:hypothetical protein
MCDEPEIASAFQVASTEVEVSSTVVFREKRRHFPSHVGGGYDSATFKTHVLRWRIYVLLASSQNINDSYEYTIAKSSLIHSFN